ncbi:MAG: hypothetical protein OEW00_05645 [candidate division Zixibacteria bacterium]|nr:hypothetical protein [candidate division Zixibacteria bacterium]
MKSVTAWLILAILAPTLAACGEIYGTVKEGVTPVGEGVEMAIVFPDTTYTGKTADRGRYSICVARVGKCTVRVAYADQTPEAEIYSFEESARYNLILQRQPDGKYTITVK